MGWTKYLGVALVAIACILLSANANNMSGGRVSGVHSAQFCPTNSSCDCYDNSVYCLAVDPMSKDCLTGCTPNPSTITAAIKATCSNFSDQKTTGERAEYVYQSDDVNYNFTMLYQGIDGSHLPVYYRACYKAFGDLRSPSVCGPQGGNASDGDWLYIFQPCASSPTKRGEPETGRTSVYDGSALPARAEAGEQTTEGKLAGRDLYCPSSAQCDCDTDPSSGVVVNPEHSNCYSHTCTPDKPTLNAAITFACDSFNDYGTTGRYAQYIFHHDQVSYLFNVAFNLKEAINGSLLSMNMDLCVAAYESLVGFVCGPQGGIAYDSNWYYQFAPCINMPISGRAQTPNRSITLGRMSTFDDSGLSAREDADTSLVNWVRGTLGVADAFGANNVSDISRRDCAGPTESQEVSEPPDYAALHARVPGDHAAGNAAGGELADDSGVASEFPRDIGDIEKEPQTSPAASGRAKLQEESVGTMPTRRDDPAMR